MRAKPMFIALVLLFAFAAEAIACSVCGVMWNGRSYCKPEAVGWYNCIAWSEGCDLWSPCYT